MRLLIEPINSYDIPGYFLCGSQQAVDVIAECGADNLFLQYDIYHMQLADTPGRHEPGTGEINYRYLFGVIDALGYDGWIGCEYIPLADTLAGLAWRKHLL